MLEALGKVEDVHLLIVGADHAPVPRVTCSHERAPSCGSTPAARRRTRSSRLPRRSRVDWRSGWTESDQLPSRQSWPSWWGWPSVPAPWRYGDVVGFLKGPKAERPG